jgi:uncharacterized Zn-binding protein involved in type VI secretion
MSIRRYFILLGAKTDVGGTVKTASSFMSYDGTGYALERDLIDCPACGSEGFIKCVPPRLDDTCNGVQLALEHDLCICKCSPPPRLIANQHSDCQIIEGGAAGMSNTEAAGQVVASHVPTSATNDEAVPLRLVDRGTKEPYRYRPYKLEMPGGGIEGVTDDEGFTKPLSAAERAALIAWHITDTVPAA